MYGVTYSYRNHTEHCISVYFHISVEIAIACNNQQQHSNNTATTQQQHSNNTMNLKPVQVYLETFYYETLHVQTAKVHMVWRSRSTVNTLREVCVHEPERKI